MCYSSKPVVVAMFVVIPVFRLICSSLLSLSISSTLMEMESTVSSGRSTPAMMNGQSSSASSAAKTVAYPCCWDLCLQYFSCSPDLAEHIRSIHVDGQRGGVSRQRSVNQK